MNCLHKLLGAFAAKAFPPNAVLIDVRSPGEFAQGFVDGAYNVPLPNLTEQIHQRIPDLATPIVVYCASGNRSAKARTLLARLGYRNVVNGGSAGAVSRKMAKPITTKT